MTNMVIIQDDHPQTGVKPIITISTATIQDELPIMVIKLIFTTNMAIILDAQFKTEIRSNTTISMVTILDEPK